MTARLARRPPRHVRGGRLRSPLPHLAAAPMQTLDATTPQFLTDADGNRTAVVLSMEDFE